MNREKAARAIEDFLRAIGRDPTIESDLIGTGERVADAYLDLCAGYEVDIEKLFRENTIVTKPAENGGTVMLRGIATTTMCPHHLMPASGTAVVAYEASDRILGVGAIARLVDAFARRLTLQEHIGNEVVKALGQFLSPSWAACKIEMQHTCMTARGERRHGTTLVTFATFGDASRAMQIVGMSP